MTANDSESFLGYLNNKYSDTYHQPIGKHFIDADCSALAE